MKEFLLLGSVHTSTNQVTSQFHFALVRAGCWGPVLAQLYLSRVGGEKEHDGEARQQAGVLDGEGEEEAAAARVLLLTTYFVHLWKHVCQSDVEEHSPCQGKDPVWGEAIASQDAKAHAQVTATS